MIDKKVVRKLAEERIEELDSNLFIVDLNISSTNTINVEIDKDNGGVSIDECVSVSRNIEHNLDREIADFELNVSSAGLDKPLRHLRQFLKNIGKSVEVKYQNGKKQEGILIEATESTIKIQYEEVEKPEGSKKKIKINKEETIDLSTVKEVKIVILFK
jgi:ribosome maturation factor RimP